jgi:hypothetical protein
MRISVRGIMTSKTRYFVILSLSILTVGVGTGLTAYYVGFPAGALAADSAANELRLVSSKAAFVGYADVHKVMTSELRQRLRRALPAQENGQREFQNLTGINIETDITHVVAFIEPTAPGSNLPGAGMVLASGLFDEVKIESLMRQHGATVEPYKDKRLIVVSPDARRQALPQSDASGPGPAAPHPTELALAFLKTGLVAVGTADSIRQAVDLEQGGENITSNDEVMNLIRSIDSGNVWAVGRFDAIQSAANLPPALSQLPAITWFSVTGQINDTISGAVRAETRDDESAANLRAVVNGFLALARMQAGSKPEFQALAQSLQLSGTGKTVELSFSVPGAIFDLLETAGNQLRKREPAH